MSTLPTPADRDATPTREPAVTGVDGVPPRETAVAGDGVPLRETAVADLVRAADRAATELLVPPAATLGHAAAARLGDVVPAPEQVHPVPGADHRLGPDTVIRVGADPAARAVADQLAALLRPATGYPLPVTDLADPESGGGITLTLTDDEALGPEGYRLDVDRDAVRVTAGAPAGLLYAVQTLRQLLPAAVESATPVPGPWILPGGSIVDRPRFPYRGAMLDVARHFFPVADVLRVIDHLVRYKLNHLHLHLTDDQGWRIAVDAWPRLTTVGGMGEVGDGPGGSYSTADYQRIVRYAADRHVTVVPEIDLPGHTNAALVAYPELAPEGVDPPTPYTGTEVGFSYVDPASERTYDFIADVLGEVAAHTPGPWLHIGGDEAFKVKGEAYTGFVERVQRLVAATGKTVVGWHQIAPAAHAEGRVLQWWGTTPDDPTTAEAVRRGARVIASPANLIYLDMKYAPDTPIGHDWAGLIDVRRAYDWDPGSHLTGVPAEAILGVEAPLWTESVTSLPEIEFMLFPRLPAVAELGWSPRSTHDWAGFRERLAGHAPRWTTAGITFHAAPEVPWPVAIGPGTAPAATIPTQPTGQAPPTAPPIPAGDPIPAGTTTRVEGPPGADGAISADGAITPDEA
ncbi:hexosaminidase [Micromonospora krabiensis]|uniref:beta-N-acetylhexosaminidase n=1 Tax=Micromonospora krabiensis TaxID=307121 RepID=A0A1C3NCD1_9ACTN|nr:beta-N-acetylhexosaminidase [Micromonospora krabiensis]SBV30209.1 hexosaminidase [Micromonospora krabiensis]